MATPTSSGFVFGGNLHVLPTDTPPTNPPPPSDNANADVITKRLQTMLLETAKQQVHIDPTPLPNERRFDSPNNFLQFSIFADAVRERLRGRLWNAKFEAWISQQLGPTVAQRYSSRVQALPIVSTFSPTRDTS